MLNHFILTKVSLFWVLSFLITVRELSVPTKVFAYNFHYSSKELEIFNTDFDNTSGWLLSNTVINSGTLKAISSWGKASYSISPVNLDSGSIFLYWSGIFPKNARTESDKYYVGLQYADNAPVCYSSQTNIIVGTPPCRGNLVSIVDENAEIKVEMRSRNKTNPNNTYHKLYIDPDFEPVNNYSPANIQLNVPNYQEAVPLDFRLKISKVNLNNYRAILSFWNGTSWQSLTAKQGYNFPLKIGASDWMNVNGKVENPVTFEAINLQFRQAAANQQSAITSLALTQIRPQLTQLRQQPVQVPEASSTVGLFFVLGFGGLLTHQKTK